MKELYNFLPPEDKIIIRSICSFFKSTESSKKLIKSISSNVKLGNDDKHINFWKNEDVHISFLKKIGDSCLKTLGGPEIALVSKELCGGIRFEIPTTIQNFKNIQIGLQKKAFYNGPIDGVFGPETCKSLYNFLKEIVTDFSSKNLLNNLKYGLTENRYLIGSDFRNDDLSKYLSNVCRNDKAYVKRLQENLRTLGLYLGEIDGLYGKGTKKAYDQFEKQLGSQISKQDGCIDFNEEKWLDLISNHRLRGHKCTNLQFENRSFDIPMYQVKLVHNEVIDDIMLGLNPREFFMSMMY